MYYIKKRLEDFQAAHRLIHYEGPCKNLHGHTYRVSVKFSGEMVDERGILIDFDDIAKICNQWVQDHWDHSVLVTENDTALLNFAKKETQKYFIVPGSNTTAEYLAQHLFSVFKDLMTQVFVNKTIRLQSVSVAESECSKAIYSDVS